MDKEVWCTMCWPYQSPESHTHGLLRMRNYNFFVLILLEDYFPSCCKEVVKMLTPFPTEKKSHVLLSVDIDH